MTANGIDLTTLSAVKSWVQISNSATSDDVIIQDAITAFSAQVLRMTGRGPQDGSIPTTSPFTAIQSYTETYDGSGSMRQAIRNWPIATVTSLSISGQSIPQSTSVSVWGWVIDGDGKFLSIRGGGFGYGYGNGRNLRGCATGGFFLGVQNVAITYTAGFSAVPFDLEMAARKTVALYYKRRMNIGQRSQAMAQGAGTVMFDLSEMEPDVLTTINYYRRRAS